MPSTKRILSSTSCGEYYTEFLFHFLKIKLNFKYTPLKVHNPHSHYTYTHTHTKKSCFFPDWEAAISQWKAINNTIHTSEHVLHKGFTREKANKEINTHPVFSGYHSWLEVKILWHLKGLQPFFSVSLQTPAGLISVLAEPGGLNASVILSKTKWYISHIKNCLQ